MERVNHSLDLTKYCLEAAKSGDLEAVKHFIYTGSADMDANDCSDRNKFTALMWAVYNNDLKMVNYLIGEGASLEVRSGCLSGFGVGNINPHSEYTPLMIASGTAGDENGVKIIQSLLDAGADTEARASGGQTAIMMTYDIPSLKALIHAGANVNAADARGFTLLMRLAWSGYTNAAKFLIESGADHTVKDEKGLTAVQHARYNGNHMAEIFESVGIVT